MTRLKLLLCIGLLTTLGIAQAKTPPIKLESPSINIHDRQSLIRGAKFYKQNCLICHSLKYMQHDPIAKKTGLDTKDMPNEAQLKSFKIPPPDLSLEVRYRGADWVYTYLISFYKDPSQPTGSNNLVLQNTQMPNILQGMHGTYELITDYSNLKQYQSIWQKPAWYDALKKVEPGSMSQQEFEDTLNDLVNFLAYASDPKALKRHHIGIGVLVFLIILLILAIALKRAYWKDIK